MVKDKIREVLNKIKWTEKDPNNFSILYVDRGSPDDRKEISFERIKEIRGSYFLLDNDVVIPFHRIILIKNKETKEIYWRRAREK